MIEKERVESIKQGTDIIALIQSRGIKLKKNGQGYAGLCPFHNDTNPSLSVNPTKNLWQCFGCGTGGDVIRFVELFDKVTFPEAVKKINGEFKVKSAEAQSKDKAKAAGLPVAKQKLLSRVVDFYHTAFAEDSRAMEYLKQRGITDKGVLSAYKVGFANGTLLNVLPDEGDVIGQLKETGILNEKGHEHFYGCVTFPLYDLAGHPAGIYGRRIDDMVAGNVPDHLYLPGPRAGIFNRQAARLHKEIILTEAVIDSLTLIDAGISNTIPCYGTNGLTDEHIALFKQSGVKTVYIAFDADDTGRQASAAVLERLTSEGFAVRNVELPDGKDINVFFTSFSLAADAVAGFKALLHTDAPGVVKKAVKEPKDEDKSDAKDEGEGKDEGGGRTGAISIDPERGKTAAITSALAMSVPPGHELTDYGLAATISGRRYELRGIAKNEGKLKATVKGIQTGKDGKRFHVDTVDFYSARSRAFLARGLSELFGESEQIINADLAKLLELAEDYKPSLAIEDQAASQPAISPQEQEEALAFLMKPEMFKEILNDMETIGVTGEETNKLVGYLSAVSRKLDEPLSVLIQSRSAAGKSTLQDAILSLVPGEDYVKYTRITDQALFYKKEDSLAHKIVAIEEEEGMGGAAYSIRNIQSSGKITVAAAGKDPATGKLTTEEYTVKGPVAVMITTTAAELEGETASRFLFLTIDESTKMTEAIHQKQREADTLAGLVRKSKREKIIRKHHTAQRLLKPLAVVNPYTKYLTYPAGSLRSRRDHKKYLNLIRAIAFLFQCQREIKVIDVEGKAVEYIEVYLEDIEKANRLANEVLGQSMDELAKPSRTLLSLIYKMVKEHTEKGDLPIDQFFFNRRMLREYAGWTDWQIRAHIKQLEEMEYVYVRVGNRGKEYSYALQYKGQAEEEEGRCYLNLTPVEEIKKLIGKAENKGKEKE